MKYKYSLLFPLALGVLFSGTTIASSAPSMEDAQNTAYQGIHKTNITLKNGRWEGKPYVKDGAARPMVGMIKDFTFTGDLDADGTEERVVFLWKSSGGSGTRVYVAVLGDQGGKPVNLGTHLIGDRVQLQMGQVNKGKIELDVIQAQGNDAACCPTHKIFRSWSLKNQQFRENKPQSLGQISLMDLKGVEWVMTQMNWNDVLPEDSGVTMTFQDDKISGRSACNRYFAGVEAGAIPGDISIGRAGSTMMACPLEAMALEQRYLKALSSVYKYSFLNGKLALTWKDEDSIGTMLFSARNIK